MGHQVFNTPPPPPREKSDIKANNAIKIGFAAAKRRVVKKTIRGKRKGTSVVHKHEKIENKNDLSDELF